MNGQTLSLKYHAGAPHSVLILLGGNQGHRTHYLQEAFQFLTREVGPCVRASSMYESEPWGFTTDVLPFLNRVVFLQTRLSPEKVIEKTLFIENQLGRVRSETVLLSYTSRTVDIDVLFYDERVMETPSLIIPHPRMALRKFVLVPLAELMPNQKHPVFGVTIMELLLGCTDELWVRMYRGEKESQA